MKKAMAAAAMLSIALVLVGCSSPVDKLQDKAGEKIAEKAMEDAASDGSSGDVNVDIDAGGGASLPDTWPSELPLPEAKLTFVTSSEADKSYYLMFESTDGADAAGVVDKLKAAGFTQNSEISSDGTTIVGLSNATWTVGYTYGAESDGVWTIMYTVTPATS